ncbi:MAG: hypothetical protein UW19_C0015G0024 [Candidatus Moranbacteria bacterium GW2011_GWF2_44_10]|nr:MAG: hypothetical protein UW19_C0015G0024 [Candidatus Moranbacteria bacterium GW2011_GWF2_44_10]
MKRESELFLLAIILVTIAFSAGCVGPIHEMEKSGLVQLQTAAPISARPGGKYVYVNCRDGTGNNLDIQNRVISLIRSRGYISVSDPKLADYQLTGGPNSISYQQDRSRTTGGGQAIGALMLGALAGGLVGGFTGNAGLATAAAIGAIGGTAEAHAAPGIVIASVNIRIDERINFLSERQAKLPQPIQKVRKVKKTLKSGKKVWVTEDITETEDAETPVKSTVAAAQSGAGATTVVTDRRVADFVPHQATFEVKHVVESSTPADQIKNLLAEKIAAAIANIL